MQAVVRLQHAVCVTRERDFLKETHAIWRAPSGRL